MQNHMFNQKIVNLCNKKGERGKTQACLISALRFVWIRCRQSCSLLHLSFFVLSQIKDWRQFKSEAYKGHLIPTPVCTGIQGLACIFLNIISFHPQYICFTVSSCFAQGYRDLNAVLWRKLETGPRFANIWTLVEFKFFIEFPPPNFDHRIFCLSIFLQHLFLSLILQGLFTFSFSFKFNLL